MHAGAAFVLAMSALVGVQFQLAVAAAPDQFVASFTSTAGTVRINVTRALAPIGVDNFYGLLTSGYYDDNGFVRIEKWAQQYNFIQWGIASDPILAQNKSGTIPDDPPCFQRLVGGGAACLSNVNGTVALAADAMHANSRSTMIYVNMADNAYLDAQTGFVPFGVVADAESWATLYNITTRWLEVIYLPMVYGGGSAWLREQYPGLDFTVRGTADETDEASAVAAAAAAAVALKNAAVAPPAPAAAAPAPPAPPRAASSSFSYNVSWLGNTGGGGPDQFVPRNASWVSYCADDLDVDASGWAFTNTGWDEGTREGGVYGPGGTIEGLMADLHGWNRAGGRAVAAGPVASNRVYVGMSQAPLSYPGPLRDYPARDTWYGFRVYDRAGATQPCPPSAGCRGWDSSIVVVCANCSELGGLAVSPDGGEVYTSDTTNGLVKVYDAASLTLLRSWPVPRPGKLAVEPATGNVWVAPWTNVSGLQWPYAGGLPASNAILRFTAAGAALPDAVTDVALPADVAVDAAAGCLVVADNGPAQQVIYYALPEATATQSAPDPAAPAEAAAAGPVGLARTLVVGALGGVLAGASPGLVSPGAFAFLTGVGVVGDDLVVASVGYTTNKLCSGLDLRRLALQPTPSQAAAAHRAATAAAAAAAGRRPWPAAAPSANVTQVWNLLGLEWVDSAHAAPAWPGAAPGTDVVFTEHERFVLDYAAPQGAQWVYAGYTVDPVRFGASDARLQPGDFPTPSVTVRSVGGRTHLFASGMYTQGPAWYRMEREAGGAPAASEIAIPCGLLSKDDAKAGAWPATQGAVPGSPFLWQDTNGDGLMTPPEFTALTGHWGGVWGTWVDEDGGLWVASEDHWLVVWQPVGLSASGCLAYNLSAPPAANVSGGDLAPLSQTERPLYLPASDTLFVTGFTAALGNPNRTWGQAGRWVQRYDGFLRGGRTPGAGWMLPWTNRSCPGVCSVDDAKAVYAVDDLLVAVTSESATVYVYNGTTGGLLGTMSVAAGGPAMGNYTGWVDTPFGLTVARAARGTLPGVYVAFVEEDGREKVVVYTFTVGS